MSSSLFPTLAGAQLDVERTPIYSTTVQTEASGRELRAAWMTAARYRYRIPYDFLRQDAAGDEAATLLAFFDAHKGSYESFLFTDPYDGVTRRVRFAADELPLQRRLGRVWRGEVELLSVAA